MKWIIIFILFPLLCYGQWFSETLFPATYDTMSSATTKDTIEARLGNGTLWGPWKQLTESHSDTADITATDKKNEVTKVYELADEAWWTWGALLEVRIRSHAGSDTITSNTFSLQNREGAITLWIYPDTTGSKTDYGGSLIGGR